MKKITTIYIDEEDIERLKMEGAPNEDSLSKIIRKIIKEHFENKEAKKP